MKKLENKVAVITGASTGLALATAKLFVEEGAYVFITGRRKKELDDAVKEIGHNVTGVQADSGKLEDLDKLYETVKKEKGNIDVLMASAGIADYNINIDSITPEQYDNVFNVNVKGTLFTVQKALPLLNDGASIIITGSTASIKGLPGLGVYSATKAALRSFARTWTSELQHRKIRVNVLSPSSIKTAALEAAPQSLKDGLIAQIPMGRFGEPEEVATTALFLASKDSGYITGSELYVDGGSAQI